ncbi:hypothetical protein B0J13DRAFT_572151 [Dactylonectria estremocensis]|uniref:Zn(2)-C6 fungal-type domain-containing protein n=1 Tax=Dactylonectria estremocensis TaxID=1079267 RepID=A0A9P9IDG4_9HYPO|nr:hypothetical protein B0J13DRAFT_572151 [Dactylonectria estremocensis]
MDKTSTTSQFGSDNILRGTSSQAGISRASRTLPTASGPAILNDPQHSKRRRCLGSVTANACTQCRKKRTKCDGQRPCGRCKAQEDVECVYEIPVLQTKANMRAEIESLRAEIESLQAKIKNMHHQQRSSDHILTALIRPVQDEEVLTRLRKGQSIESISEWLSSTLLSGSHDPTAFTTRVEDDLNIDQATTGFYDGSLGSLTTISSSVDSVLVHQLTMKIEDNENDPWHFSCIISSKWMTGI